MRITRDTAMRIAASYQFALCQKCGLPVRHERVDDDIVGA
jgi:hypothetical protein